MTRTNFDNEFDENEEEVHEIDRYTTKYRLIKTVLLTLAWVSFGLNNELVGPTFEDLKILLSLNYQKISLALVLKNVGYLVMVPISGVILDKFSKYADLIMAVCSILYAIRNKIFNVIHHLNRIKLLLIFNIF